VNAEGWYQDPYGLHEDRWFSDGRPTGLVRDGKIESDDAPPPEATAGPLQAALRSNASAPDDLRRADDASHATDSVNQIDRVLDVFDEYQFPT
jgi:hypothetical protein